MILWRCVMGWWRIGLEAGLLVLILLSLCSRGRMERAIRILAMGLLCGLLWTGFYQRHMESRVEPAEVCSFSAELTGYPKQNAYGCTVLAVTNNSGNRTRMQLRLADYDPDWKPGDVFTGTGSLQYFEADENGNYYRSIGVWIQGEFSDITAVSSVKQIPIRYQPAVWAHGLQQTIAALYPADVQRYLQALLTGDKSLLSYQEKSDLQMAGIYHTLAVSGMHVSILMSMLTVLLLRSRRLTPILGIPTLVLYCLMVGCPASVVRAAVMQAFLLLGTLVHREADAPTSLGLSLFCLTLENPWCLTNIGLQLSFLATIGILVCSRRIYNGLYLETTGRGKKLLRNIRSILAQTCGALLFTIPVMASSFGMVSVVSILSNLLMTTAITLCFTLGFISCALWYLIPVAAKLVAVPVTWLFRYVIWLTKNLARVSFAALYPQSPYLLFWLVFAYGIVLFLSSGKLKRPEKKIAGYCMAMTLCLCLLLSWVDRKGTAFTFKALNVGQGQCLLVESGGYTAAIDCGGSYGDEAGELLARELLACGQTQLDYLVLTHFDDDHTGGMRQLFHRVPVKMLLVSDLDWDNMERNELLRMALQYDTEVRLITEDQTIPFGKGTLQIFAPVSETGGNASCLSVLATFGTYDILATGDLAIRQERILLATHDLPDVELLVAGHHGSASSTGEELLNTVCPELVVISVGENSYGHPADAVLERIAASGAVAIRTDESGTITVRR